MIISFLKEEKLNELKANINALSQLFIEKDSTSLQHELGDDAFEKTVYDLQDEFRFDVGITKNREKNKTDAINAIKLHQLLKDLPYTVAADERFWVGLCFEKRCWDYFKYRWDIKQDANDILVKNIKQHFFFSHTQRRNFTRHALARLWWIAELTYNKDSSDHYEFTNWICKYSRYIGDLLERNFSNNKNILLPVISAIMKAEQDYSLSTDNVRSIAEEIDKVGGTYILDYLPNNKIQEKVLSKIKRLIDMGKIIKK